MDFLRRFRQRMNAQRQEFQTASKVGRWAVFSVLVCAPIICKIAEYFFRKFGYPAWSDYFHGGVYVFTFFGAAMLFMYLLIICVVYYYAENPPPEESTDRAVSTETDSDASRRSAAAQFAAGEVRLIGISPPSETTQNDGRDSSILCEAGTSSVIREALARDEGTPRRRIPVETPADKPGSGKRTGPRSSKPNISHSKSEDDLSLGRPRRQSERIKLKNLRSPTPSVESAPGQTKMETGV